MVLLLLLAGCSLADVRDIRVEDVDLNDQTVIRNIRNELAPDERPAFATYVLFHWPGSKQFCGSPLADRSGKIPATIGEAIEETRLRELDLEQARLAQSLPRADTELNGEQRMLAVDKLEALTLQRDMLLSEPDVDTSSSGKLRRIEAQLDIAREELARRERGSPPV